MMKKLILLAVIGLLLIPSAVLAKTFQEDIVVGEDEVIDRNFIRAGRSIEILGEVQGDVIIAASEIKISGKVGGDVIAAAADIAITGEVDGNIRIAANNIDLGAKIGRNLNAFASTVNLAEDNQVGWSAMLFAANIDVRGLIGGHLLGGASSVDIYGEIGGDAKVYLAESGKIDVYGEARIGGLLDYQAKNENQLSVKSGAEINEQKLTIWQAPEINWSKILGISGTFYFFTKIVEFLSLLVIGLILVALFKEKLYQITEKMWKKSGRSMGWGLVYLIVTPIVILVFLLTVIGIPLAIIIGCIYGIALYLTSIFVSLLIGRRLLSGNQKDKQVNMAGALALGLLIYLILTSLPFIGWLVGLVGTIWVLGALVELAKKIKMPKKSNG